MFVIKAGSECDETFEWKNMFLVKSEEEADRIVGEFNSASARYSEHVDAINEFREQYVKDHPYPVLGKVAFPVGGGTYQDDRYMTVDDEYLARYKKYQELLKDNEQTHNKNMQGWLDAFNKEVEARFHFSWNFPYSNYLENYKRYLHRYSFCYEKLSIK